MTFWGFMASWPSWVQVIFAILFIAACLSVVITALVKGIEITRGKVKIRINKKNENKKNRVSPHENCPYAADFIIIFNELDKIRFEQWQIIYINQLKDQMTYAKQRAEQIKIILQQKYLSLLDEKKVDHVVSSNSFIAYQLVLTSMVHEMLEIARESFKENHFDTMTEQEFLDYSTDKANYIIDKGSELLNSLYFYKEIATREETYLYNRDAIPKMRELVMETYVNARKVSLENKEKLKALEERVEKLLEQYRIS